MQQQSTAQTDLVCAVYVSSSAGLPSCEELTALIVEMRERNARNGVTGVLLYKDGDFMQAIEGPHDGVMRVQDEIFKDSRHHQTIRMLLEPIQFRMFPGWELRCPGMTEAGRLDWESYSKFLWLCGLRMGGTEAAQRVMTLLMSFKRALR